MNHIQTFILGQLESLLFLTQFLATGIGRCHGAHGRVPEVVLLERLYPRNGGAPGGAHLVLEHAWVGAGFQLHARRSLHGLSGKLQSNGPRQARFHARVRDGLDEQEHVSRPAPAHRSNGV